MHADLIAALVAGYPRAHLVTVVLPGGTIRWTDGGLVVWGSDTYSAHDATYGVLQAIGDITDGIDDDGSPVSLTILPPSLASLADLAAADAQGGRVTIHLTAVHPDTHVMQGDPYRLWIGELDQPRLSPGEVRELEYDILPGEARGLEPNEEQRQTNAFHKLCWPDEKGQEYATDGPKIVRWRDDEPRNALGLLRGRGGADKSNPVEFTYEPEAPLVFPFGRCALSGEMRFRVGYGPTNRYNSYVATCGASGPIQALISVTFDDIDVTFDGDDRSTDGEHTGFEWFSFLPGDQPSAALAGPTGPEAHSGQPDGWTSDHKLSGKPCFMWTGKENSKKDEFRGDFGKPLVTLDGLYGWDSRDVGADIADPTTWPGVIDGATAGLNWAIGRWEGSDGGSPAVYGAPYACVLVGGIGAPLDLIDADAFEAAADVADFLGWEVSAVPTSEEDKTDVLNDLLKAAGAWRSRKSGLISCVSFAEEKTSVLTVTARDCAKAPTVSLGPSRLDRRNTGIGKFRSADHRWEMTAIEAITDSAWVTEDGGRRSKGFSYRFVPDADQCAALVYYDLANEREPIGAEVEFFPWMLQVEAGECVDWEEPEYLLDGVKTMVRRRTYSPANGLVTMEVRSETDAKHAAAIGKTGTAPPATTPGEPVEPVGVPPTNWVVTDDGTTVTMGWRNPIDLGFDNTIRYRATGSTSFGAASSIGGAAGGLGESMSRTDTPGAGTHSYWITAIVNGIESSPVGPETVTL